MPLLPFNSVGGYSTGITATAVIDVLGNITGVGATFSGLIRANAGISSAGGTFSALTRFTAGISASGGMTLAGGTFNLDANIELKRPSNSTTTIQAYYSPAPGFYDATSFISLSPLNGITFGGGNVNVPGYLNVDISSRSATESTVPLIVKGTVTPFPQLVNMTNWVNGSGTILSSILVGGGFSGPASNFSGLVTANAGISSAGGTFGGNIRLQNAEYIQNTTNGRIDFMPAPAGSTHYGMYLDFTSWGYGPRFGTIRSSDGALNTTGILWDAQLNLGTNVRFNFGSDGQNGVVLSDTGNNTIQLFTTVTTGTNSGAVAIVDVDGVNAANRAPGVTHTNPNLYVYRAGSANANDFIRFEHDGTNGRIISGGTSGTRIEPGSGILGISGGINASGGFTFGSPSGTTFMVFRADTALSGGGIWLRDGVLQVGGSALASVLGAFSYNPNSERFYVFGYSDFNNSYNYQSGRCALRINGAPTQSVPIFAAYKQTVDGTQLSSGFTATNMVAGIDQNGVLFSNAGISAAGGATFSGTVSSDTGYRITSSAINAQTGTTYTFLDSDNGKIVTFNNGSAITVTIPTGLPVGFNCTAIQLGAGQVGFTAASGVTLQSYGNQFKLIGQHASAALLEYSTNIVNLSGNLIV
jgi:hypothetical protein